MRISKTNKSACGTSFHGTTIRKTPQSLIDIFGEPTHMDNCGDDKVNMEWDLEIGGEVITIYDWKEYRPLGMNEMVEWHIGGDDKSTTERAKRELV